jgi:hypothetical protein
MNAKEKAKELIERYRSISLLEKYNSKECALIAVEEILSLKLWGKTYGKNDRDFWIEVKAEIRNVQPKNDIQCGVGKNNI